MSPDTFIHEGEKMEIRPTDGRYTCVHAFIEEVSYPWFVQMGGDTIAIPIEEPCPMVMCGLELHDDVLKSCIGKECKHYKNAYLDEGAGE